MKEKSSMFFALNPKEAAILSRIAESRFVTADRIEALLQGSNHVVLNAARAIVDARENGTLPEPSPTAPVEEKTALEIARAFVESSRTNRRPVRKAL